jgi:uncharacterized protein YabN with tetrapyrrole methylase and pyrophosphatase domain
MLMQRVRVSPFAERLINKEHLPYNFIKLIEREIKRQQKQVKQGKCRFVQINFNKMFEMENQRAITDTVHKILRRMVMCEDQANDMLVKDIQRGNVDEIITAAKLEYEYQKKQVKKGLRKHITVDFNDLYYC